MKNLSKTAKYLIAVLLLCIGAGGGFMYLIWVISKNHAKAQEIATTLGSSSLRDSQLLELKALVRNSEDERQILNRFFVVEAEVVPFLRSIEELGALSGVRLEVESLTRESTAQPEKSAKSKKATTTPKTIFPENNLVVNISYFGSWEAVSRFTSLIEAVPYALAIDQLLLEYNEREGVAPLWSGTLRFKVIERSL